MSEGKIITFNESNILNTTSGHKTNAIKGNPFENSYVFN